MVEEARAYVQGESLKARAALLREVSQLPDRQEGSMRIVFALTFCILAMAGDGAAQTYNMDDAERTKTELYRCVARNLALVDDGVSAPAQVGAAAAQLCPAEVRAEAQALDQALGSGAGDGILEAVQGGKPFATLVLMRRASLLKRAK